ncbi:MAG TPA: hypothetical protein VKG84_05600 [Candidatus Acidoferrales bacterium]|nr:hypothetical protein [Candidatus Acidoferrales bacterium]
MKTVLTATAAILLLGLLAGSQAGTTTAPRQANQGSAEKIETTPFYCNMHGLNPEQRKRKTELDGILRGTRTGARELPDGFEFQFPADPATFRTVAEWVVMERACCPFFDLELRLEREGGPFWLRLTGREGVKKFIKGEFREAWFR